VRPENQASCAHGAVRHGHCYAGPAEDFMRRSIAVRALLCALGCWGSAGSAPAETLFSLSGQVALADGVAPDGV
jgi:hypothetical protein